MNFFLNDKLEFLHCLPREEWQQCITIYLRLTSVNHAKARIIEIEGLVVVWILVEGRA
jgi:hypothetical protein